MLSICTKHAHSQAIAHVIYLVRFLHHQFSHRLQHLHCTDLELIFFSVYARHMRTATLTFKPFSQPVCTVEALGSDQM
jgi:hypothetical protein